MSVSKTIVITGVSSGIGKAAAEYFLSEGYRVFGSVRKAEDAAPLGLFEKFTPLLFDVTDREAIDIAAGEVRGMLNGERLDVLINNAGIARYGPLMHIPPSELKENLEVNVMGVLHVTQAFLPLLGAITGDNGPKGRIINIGSVSGRFAMPLIGPYSASKHALVGLTHALRRELLLHGIYVSLIEPASADSSIWAKAREAETHTTGTAYAVVETLKDSLIDKQEKKAMPTSKVVKVISRAVESRRPKARYLITPNNTLNRIVHALPDRWMDYVFKRAFDKANANSE